MKCSDPVVVAGNAYGCGQCVSCRINRKRIWSHRIKLEAAQYAENTFLTLTYADEFLPKLMSLEPWLLKSFLHRVRTRVRRSKALEQEGKPRLIRFFAVGEYGDLTERPHYHVMLFNYPSCLRGKTRSRPKYDSCCAVCDLISELWYRDEPHQDFGRVQLDPYDDKLAKYICGYVTKKMTRFDDGRLNGRHPEFARQSNRPGIGAGALHGVADVLLRYYDVASELGDVPSALDHGGSRLPLGRYMRGRLRELVGMHKNAPKSTLAEMEVEMLALREAQMAFARKSLKEIVAEANAGKVASQVARYKMFKQRRVL